MKTLTSLKTVSVLASLVYIRSPTVPVEADRTKKNKGRLKRNHWIFPEGNFTDHKENKSH